MRTKLLLALAPLALALVLVGVAAVETLESLAHDSEAILRENYRSVLAAQRMKESLERLEDTVAADVVALDNSALNSARGWDGPPCPSGVTAK